MPHYKLPYAELTDIQLFGLVKQNDIRSFEEIYTRYWPFLIDTAYKRIQSRQKAEDLVQDIFISLYQKRYTLELSVSFKHYLGQAVKFRVLNLLRDEYTRTNCQKEIYFKESVKREPSIRIETSELSQKIEAVILRLPEKCRKAFLLSRREERTHKDISQELQISVSTVEKHIGKALKLLKSNLQDYPLSY